MQSFFQISMIFVSILLVGVILVQVRGQGSGFFGSAQASFRTRRGVEKTLFPADHRSGRGVHPDCHSERRGAFLDVGSRLTDL